MEKQEASGTAPVKAPEAPAVKAPPAKQEPSKQADPKKSAPKQEAAPLFKAPKKKRKWPRRVLILLVVAALAFFLLQRFSRDTSAALSASYLTDTVQTMDMTVAVSGTGLIQPEDTAYVSAMVKGDVLESLPEEGDTVQKGDVLFRIDSSDVQTAIEQSELAKQQAQLSYDTLQSSQKDTKLTANASGIISRLYVEAGDTVMAGQQIADILDRKTMELQVPFHSVDTASIPLGSAASVVVDGTAETIMGTVTQVSGLDEVGPGGTILRTVTISVQNPGVITDKSTGTATVGLISCAGSGSFRYSVRKTVSSKFSGEIVSLPISEGDSVAEGQVICTFDAQSLANQLESARLGIENADLSHQSAVDSLDKYTITAPISGLLVEKNLDVGDTLDPSNPAMAAGTPGTSPYLAVIYDMSGLSFQMGINELDIGKLKEGQRVEVTADALDGQTFEAHVDHININGTSTGGKTTYPVTVRLEGVGTDLQAQGLFPGMNVSARVIVEEARPALCIPVDYVSRGNTVKVALPGACNEQGQLVDPTLIEERTVELGRSNETHIEILSGLAEGDTVLKESQSSNLMQKMMGGM